MEFSCPACATPHSFPDDQVPANGIVVACTNCGTHITLDGPPASTNADGATAAMVGDTAGAAPPSSGWGDVGQSGDDGDVLPSTMALTGDALANLPPIGETPAPAAPSIQKAPPPPEPKPAPTPTPAPPANQEPMVDPFAASTAPEPAVEAKAPAATPTAGPVLTIGLGDAGGMWSWRDLPRAFGPVQNLKWIGSLTVVTWALFLILGGLLIFSGWLGSKVSILGLIFSIITGILGFVGISVMAAMASFIGYKHVVEKESADIMAAADWVQKKILSILGTPLAFVGAILAIAIVMAILGAIGKIPYLGPILFGLTTPALLVLGLSTGLIVVTLMYAGSLYVPVVYNEDTGPLDTLKRLLYVFKANPLGIVANTLLTFLMATFTFGLTILPVLLVSWAMTTGVAGQVLGNETLAEMVRESPGPSGDAMNFLMAMPSTFGYGDGNFADGLGGLLGGIFSLLVPAFVIATLVQVFTAAGGITYAMVTGRKK